MRTRVRGGFRTIDTAHLLADVDLAAILAADGVALRKESTGSEKAPCPRCVGDDRFVYKWNTDGPPRCWCRQCWPKGGDAIGYIRWRDNCDFRAACEWLARFNGRSLDDYTGGPPLASQVPKSSPPTTPPAQAAAEPPTAKAPKPDAISRERRQSAVNGTQTPAERKPDRKHTYQDADGNDVLRVRVVYDAAGGKRVTQSTPSGKGGWKPVGLRREDWPDGFPLYRLPELLAADPSEQVYVIEGERCADDVARLGLVATTSCLGAGKADQSDWRPLAGRDVIIVPDHDAPGFRHANRLADLVTAAGGSPRIAPLRGYPMGDELPDAHGLDVSDWLADRERDDLLAVEPFPAGDRLAVPGASAGKQSLGVTVRIVSAADIQAEPVSWLWEPRIPRDALTILAGHPGVGKSYIACAIATGVSLGHGLPGRSDCEPGTVLYVTAEDHLAKVLVPRLMAMGAALDRIKLLVEGEGISAHVPCLADPDGLAMLAQHIAELRPDMVVLDPIQAFQGAGLDTHRVNEVRQFLTPLATLAERYELALVPVAHMSKSGSTAAAMRVLGSVDHTAAPRSVLVAGADPDDPADRALCHVKANLGPQAEPIGYSLADGVFAWIPETSLTAARIMGQPDPEGATAIDEAEVFLRELLADGPVPSKEVQREAEATGLAWRTVRRGKKQLKVAHRRAGRDWEWFLDVQVGQPGPNGQVGQLDGSTSVTSDSRAVHRGQLEAGSRSRSDSVANGSRGHSDAPGPSPSGGRRPRNGAFLMSTETADAATLLSHLRTLGARVVIDGDALVVDVPRGLLTPTVRAGITRAKPALLAILAGEARELDPDATARAVPDAADTADVAPNAGPASVPRCAGCGSVRVRPSVSGRNLVCLARGCWYLTPTGAPGRK